LTLLCACAKKEAAAPSYREPSGRFACVAPPDWKVLEDGRGGSSFFGPTEGPRPYNASIVVRWYGSDSEFPSPEAFYAARRGLAASSSSAPDGGPPREFTLVRRELPLHGSGEAEEIQERAFLLPAKDGFFALLHTAPRAVAEETAPVFEALRADFRPG
jgi:hypothetical protein